MNRKHIVLLHCYHSTRGIYLHSGVQPVEADTQLIDPQVAVIARGSTGLNFAIVVHTTQLADETIPALTFE